MKRALQSVLSLLRRKKAGPNVAPRFVVALSARLLISMTHSHDKGDENSGKKIIGSTRNISVSGIAIIVPSVYIGGREVTNGSTVRITLDLHPMGLIQLTGVVMRHELVEEEDEQIEHLLGVKITEMNPDDRALYLEYIGTRGWESIKARS